VRPYLDFSTYPVTSAYGEKRKTIVGYHEGEDRAPPRGTPIVAPEAGYIQYAIMRQHGDGWSPDFSWPNGTWYPYSRYYEWWAGGLAILYGQTYTHTWLHIDPFWIYNRCEKTMVMLTHEKKRKAGDYTSYVIGEVVWQPGLVNEGDVIAASGVSGYDSAPHTHYQLMTPGRNEHHVLDPRTIWT
jgi:hypothetical protein